MQEDILLCHEEPFYLVVSSKDIYTDPAKAGAIANILWSTLKKVKDILSCICRCAATIGGIFLILRLRRKVEKSIGTSICSALFVLKSYIKLLQLTYNLTRGIVTL